MKQVLLMIAVVALVGCGKKEGWKCLWCGEEATPRVSCSHCGNNSSSTPEEELDKAIRIFFVQLQKETELWNYSADGNISPYRDPHFIGNQLIKADWELVTKLHLDNFQMTELPKGLEDLTQLRHLTLRNNKLTDVKTLENLTKLQILQLRDNPNLTKAQIAELKKALPKCEILSDYGPYLQTRRPPLIYIYPNQR